MSTKNLLQEKRRGTSEKEFCIPARICRGRGMSGSDQKLPQTKKTIPNEELSRRLNWPVGLIEMCDEERRGNLSALVVRREESERQWDRALRQGERLGQPRWKLSKWWWVYSFYGSLTLSVTTVMLAIVNIWWPVLGSLSILGFVLYLAGARCYQQDFARVQARRHANQAKREVLAVQVQIEEELVRTERARLIAQHRGGRQLGCSLTLNELQVLAGQQALPE